MVNTPLKLVEKETSKKQIEGIENAWIVKADINFPMLNTNPLLMIGLLYEVQINYEETIFKNKSNMIIEIFSIYVNKNIDDF